MCDTNNAGLVQFDPNNGTVLQRRNSQQLGTVSRTVSVAIDTAQPSLLYVSDVAGLVVQVDISRGVALRNYISPTNSSWTPYGIAINAGSLFVADGTLTSSTVVYKLEPARERW